MIDFTQQLKEYSRESGADLISIAPIERFSDVPENKHPASIFPEVKSVMVVGKRITRGALRGIEEGTQFHIYNIYGRDWLNNRILAMATFKTSEFLEDNGWEAIPLPNLPPELPPMGIPVRENQPAPNVMMDFDDIAVRAGVGEIGYCGFLLTPQFGPRQRIQVILTDAELNPDPMCSRKICTHCIENEDICHIGAIKGSKVVSICGKEMAVADIDYEQCKRCKNGAFPNPYHSAGKPDRLGALCARNCVNALESSEEIENTFKNSFRKRPPWRAILEETKVLR